MSRAIAEGDRVTAHYSLSFASGRVVESSRESGPVTWQVGGNDLLAPFERRLIGLRVGDKRRFEIPGAETLGLPVNDEVTVLPRSDFPPEMKPVPGLVVSFETPAGAEAPGVVTGVSDHEVSVSFTHPLTGHDLVFEVEVLGLSPSFHVGGRPG